MAESTTHLSAPDQIRRDLRRLRRDRVIMLAGYIVIISAFLGFTFFSHAGEYALERTPTWYFALVLMFLSSAGGAALTIGIPLVSRRALLTAGAVILAAILGALLLVMDFQAAMPEDPLGAGWHCFVSCTMVAGASMLALGFLSGRLWRRFPDPGWILALGLTGVGLSALHMRCGGTDPVHLIVFHLGPVLLLYGLARGLIALREFVLRND